MGSDDRNTILMTKTGLDRIKKEYDILVRDKRPAILERLSEARLAGDLKENTEYSSSKDELAFIDGRIGELEVIMARAKPVNDQRSDSLQVGLGCRVTVKNGDAQANIFNIVGEWEADPMAKKISYQSPLGKSLMGRKIGDQVEVEAPAGKIVYTITQIK
ncbi:MAG: transcription elongation factor GreA [Candidatus Shapirobacteria bacterium]